MSLSILSSVAVAACSASEADEPESQEAAWEAISQTNEARSTHLWIVNNALRVLEKHTEELPIAARAIRILNEPTCRAQWQRGLIDADYHADFNNGRSDLAPGASTAAVIASGATWESHFYDPESGKNYKGTPKTALTEATFHLGRAGENARQDILSGGISDTRLTACYQYGLALHYFTDLTQPMHAVNFTAVMQPAKLHSNLENYAMKIQSQHPLADWSGVPTLGLIDFVKQTAWDSKKLWIPGVQAVTHAYASSSRGNPLKCGLLDVHPARFLRAQAIDHIECWEGYNEVDDVIGHTLRSAQNHTAQFIYIAVSTLPDPVN